MKASSPYAYRLTPHGIRMRFWVGEGETGEQELFDNTRLCVLYSPGSSGSTRPVHS